jgi:hypothetical protein
MVLWGKENADDRQKQMAHLYLYLYWIVIISYVHHQQAIISYAQNRGFSIIKYHILKSQYFDSFDCEQRAAGEY